MQVTETLSDGLKRSYAVRVPAADIESQTRKKLADIGKNMRLPGFRPGKVPPNLIRQRYGSSVMAEVMQDAVTGAADKLIAERQLRPAGQPRISLAGQPDPAAPAQDLDINVELELLPDITPPDLTALELTRVKAEPAEDVIARALESVAAQNRDLEDITEDRGAEKGELLVVDFTGSLDGVPFQGGTGGDVTVEVGGGGFIPGFTEQLEGMKAGETRTIDVTFPEGYQAAELAGKAAKFEIIAKALKRGVVPALDDALATKIGFESFEKLREVVVRQIQREYDQMARLRVKRDLLDVLAEAADFASPSNLLDAEFGAIWQRVEADRREGRVDEEDAGKDDETLRAEYRAIADRRVKLGLLLSEIGRLNGIQVTQAELSQALRAEAMRYPGQEQQVVEFFTKQPGAIEQLRGPIFEDKVVDHILSVAQVTDKIVPVEELAMPGMPEAISGDAAHALEAAPEPEAEPAAPEADSEPASTVAEEVGPEETV
jgi:trigger factor